MEKVKRWLSVLLSVCILAGCFLGQGTVVHAEEDEKITPSNVYYDVTIRDKTFVYIGNKKDVEWKVGDSYFMTYTVKSMEKDGTKQCGLMNTSDRDADYPYLTGTMHFAQESLLLEEGYTYFLRFDVTEDGFSYTAGKAMEDESHYVKLPHVYGEVKTKNPYFGIWLGEGEGATVELTKVSCYDMEGTDLGIYAPKASKISISEMVPRDDVNHRYSFSMENASCIAFGNARKTQSEGIFLEYTISNCEAKEVTQSGAAMSNAPTERYPHAKVGYLNYAFHDTTEECDLITEGAHYLVRFERGDKSFEVLVKRTTKDGEVDYFTYPL